MKVKNLIEDLLTFMDYNGNIEIPIEVQYRDENNNVLRRQNAKFVYVCTLDDRIGLGIKVVVQ